MTKLLWRPYIDNNIIIFKTEDEQIKVDVRFYDESVWLSIDQMAALFETIVVTIPVSAICALIREYGGFDVLLAGIKKVFRGKKAGQAGMDPFEALKAITIYAAEHIGIEGRVGSIEVGKDADLVICDGSPFELATKIEKVLIDGKLVVEN